jgi:hypothetical protein
MGRRKNNLRLLTVLFRPIRRTAAGRREAHPEAHQNTLPYAKPARMNFELWLSFAATFAILAVTLVVSQQDKT